MGVLTFSLGSGGAVELEVEHGADTEVIRADEIHTACERMLRGDVKCRFVIDNATLAGSGQAPAGFCLAFRPAARAAADRYP